MNAQSISDQVIQNDAAEPKIDESLGSTAPAPKDAPSKHRVWIAELFPRITKGAASASAALVARPPPAAAREPAHSPPSEAQQSSASAREQIASEPAPAADRTNERIQSYIVRSTMPQRPGAQLSTPAEDAPTAPAPPPQAYVVPTPPAPPPQAYFVPTPPAPPPQAYFVPTPPAPPPQAYVVPTAPAPRPREFAVPPPYSPPLQPLIPPSEPTPQPQAFVAEDRAREAFDGATTRPAPPQYDQSAWSTPKPAPTPSGAKQVAPESKENAMSRVDEINRILRKLQNDSSGLEASALISEDGLMIASALSANMEESRVAGMTATLLNLGNRAAAELKRGVVHEVVVRGDHGYAVLIGAGRGALLLALANETSRLGLIFFDMHDAVNALQKAL